MKVIDLRERFGKRYRIGWEAKGVTRREWPDDDHAWLIELRCRRGIIYPVAGEILAAWTPRPRIGTQLRRLAGILTARGDQETVVTFHIADVEAVFAVLKPYRRRQLSETQRTRNVETLARARQRRRESSLTQKDFPAPGSMREWKDNGKGDPQATTFVGAAELLTSQESDAVTLHISDGSASHSPGAISRGETAHTRRNERRSPDGA